MPTATPNILTRYVEEDKNYAIDWSKALGDDLIASAEVSAGDVTVHDVDHDGVRVTFSLSGGARSTFVPLICVVHTVRGEAEVTKLTVQNR